MGGRASEASSAAPHRFPSLALLPEPAPLPPWINCLPRNLSLVPKRLGTTVLHDLSVIFAKVDYSSFPDQLCLVGFQNTTLLVFLPPLWLLSLSFPSSYYSPLLFFFFFPPTLNVRYLRTLAWLFSIYIYSLIDHIR